MIKLTIIIPVYNVDRYIEKCLLSVINQDVDLKRYEVIIINDGSTDTSPSIIQNLIKGRENITFQNQLNCGLSLTRNTGLLAAQGEYIWFVDSDDAIMSNCLGCVINSLQEGDVFVLGSQLTYENSDRIYTIHPKPYNDEIPIEYFSNNQSMGAPFFIFRRNFLMHHNLFFKPNLLHEDFEFLPRVFYLATKISVLNKSLYHVNKRANSITTTMNPKRAHDYLKIVNFLIDFERSYVGPRYKFIFHDLCWMAINNSLYVISSTSKKERLDFSRTLKINEAIFSYLSLTSKIKYKMERILFVLFPRSIITMYSLSKSFKNT